VDVLRGAISEVEDYARVTVRPVPELAVTGRAVGDVIHLLAELIENATTFSPPNTKVAVGAEPVTNGLAIEIEDRGIGILPPILAELNTRLVNPPDFATLAERSSRLGATLAERSNALGDLSAGAQLGLFVVSRLAARHGVRVELRRSAYGGTTAVVLLPDSLLTAPGEQPALPPGTSELVPLDSASPHAPRSSSSPTTVGFTPMTAPGDPLPSRRGGLVPEQAGRLEDAETALIIATAGKPLAEPPSRPKRGGRHVRRDVIDPIDDPDGLPKRVRRREERNDDEVSSAAADEVEIATQGDGARSPEQVRAMMSSFQAGTDRGRREASDAPDGGDRTEAELEGTDNRARSDGVAQGEQSGTGGDGPAGGGRVRRRRAGGGVDGDTTVEAT
jgi:hypothetical protein